MLCILAPLLYRQLRTNSAGFGGKQRTLFAKIHQNDEYTNVFVSCRRIPFVNLVIVVDVVQGPVADFHSENQVILVTAYVQI